MEELKEEDVTIVYYDFYDHIKGDYMDTIVDEVNEGQYKELEKMWKKYVGSY